MTTTRLSDSDRAIIMEAVDLICDRAGMSAAQRAGMRRILFAADRDTASELLEKMLEAVA